jgi:CheY-like chemotaxis protein
MDIPRVLLASTSRELNALRGYILEREEVAVCYAGSLGECSALLATNEFDILVLCHSFSVNDANELVDLYRRRNPDGYVVLVNADPWQEPQTSCDVWVSANEPPDSLMRAIQKRLDISQRMNWVSPVVH